MAEQFILKRVKPRSVLAKILGLRMLVDLDRGLHWGRHDHKQRAETSSGVVGQVAADGGGQAGAITSHARNVPASDDLIEPYGALRNSVLPFPNGNSYEIGGDVVADVEIGRSR